MQSSALTLYNGHDISKSMKILWGEGRSERNSPLLWKTLPIWGMGKGQHNGRKIAHGMDDSIID
jgi:hypothetical protein